MAEKASNAEELQQLRNELISIKEQLAEAKKTFSSKSEFEAFKETVFNDEIQSVKQTLAQSIKDLSSQIEA